MMRYSVIQGLSSMGLIRWVMLTGIILWLILLVMGVIGYSGSKLVYILFSGTFFVMLISGLYRQVSYGYLFLVIFLWLGFWFKLTIHSIFHYPFVEPIGFFDGTTVAWDNVLWIAIVASIGVVMGRILYELAGRQSTMLGIEGRTPIWYPAIRGWLWLSIMVTTIIIAVINAVYGIHQIGLVPRTILHWPLNALIAWMLNIGCAMGIATLLWWDIGLKKKISLPAYAILVEAFVSTLSIISRGTYIFHTVPQIFALYQNRQILVGFSKIRGIIFFVIFVIFFTVAISSVTTLRTYLYSSSSQLKLLPTESAGVILSLASDRWIGIEGVMAIYAYPNKGLSLFTEAITEKHKIGKIPLYQQVCQSIYLRTDANKWQFGSLPGAVAFLYYSGSLWVVGFGMFIFVLFILFSESLIFTLTSNPFLSSLYGLVAANTIAQLGATPRQDIPHYFMIFCGVLFIWFIQSSLFSRILQKFGWFKKAKI